MKQDLTSSVVFSAITGKCTAIDFVTFIHVIDSPRHSTNADASHTWGYPIYYKG